MESRVLVLFLMLAALPLPGRAQDAAPAADAPVIEPEMPRRDVNVARIDTENFEVGVFGGVMNIVDFGTNPSLGLSIAYHLSEDWFVRAAAGRSTAAQTSYERLSGAARVLTDSERELTYYDLSLGYNLLPGEVFLGRQRAFPSALYVSGGVGATRFGGDDRFTLSVAAGFRLFLTDWTTIHLDVADHVFEQDLLGESRRTHNLESGVGFTFFF